MIIISGHTFRDCSSHTSYKYNLISCRQSDICTEPLIYPHPPPLLHLLNPVSNLKAKITSSTSEAIAHNGNPLLNNMLPSFVGMTVERENGGKQIILYTAAHPFHVHFVVTSVFLFWIASHLYWLLYCIFWFLHSYGSKGWRIDKWFFWAENMSVVHIIKCHSPGSFCDLMFKLCRCLIASTGNTNWSKTHYAPGGVYWLGTPTEAYWRGIQIQQKDVTPLNTTSAPNRKKGSNLLLWYNWRLIWGAWRGHAGESL